MRPSTHFPPLPLGEGGQGGGVALLAPRLRVEERQLIAAFAARGWDAALLDLSAVSLRLDADCHGLPDLVVDRGAATTGRALFAALAAAGSTVVNRSATARLLADHLAFIRHMLVADVPVPETAIAFGEASTLDALAQIGYPAKLISLTADAAFPDAILHDADAAEAVIEHRAMLGHEASFLVQRLLPGARLRVAVVGTDIIGVERLTVDSRGATAYEPVGAPLPSVECLAERVVSRLGSGVYEIHVTDSVLGPVVTGAANLVDFRSLSAAGVDVAGRIADFALALRHSAHRELVGHHG